MKFTKESLRQLISEEIQRSLNESYVDPVLSAVLDDLVIQGVKNKEKLAAKYGRGSAAAEWDQEKEDEAPTSDVPFASDDPAETQDDSLLAGMLKHGIPNSPGIQATLQLGVDAFEAPGGSATSEFIKSVEEHPPAIREKIKNYLRDLFKREA